MYMYIHFIKKVSVDVTIIPKKVKKPPCKVARIKCGNTCVINKVTECDFE